MIDRAETIKEIKTALRRRSGKTWSVTGGKGTAWGWLVIDAPPARRTRHAVKKADAITDWPEDYEWKDTGQPGGDMTAADCDELASLLGLSVVHHQGVLVPSGSDHWQEYIDRANGRTLIKLGERYSD